MKPKDISRRKFVGMGAISLPAICYGLQSCQAKPAQQKVGKVAVQLWTVRKLLENDYAGTIEQLAKTGYYAVETIPPPDGISLAEAGRIISGNGLKVCSAHVELPKDGSHNWLEVAEAFDCKNMIWHGWPEDARYQNQEGIGQLIDIYHDAFSVAKSNGMRFGLHNHWWEIETGSSGQYPFEVLHEKLDPEIFFEVDTYWAKVAGKNPADVVRKFGSRVEMLHIKDGPARYTESLDSDEPEPMVAAGQGTQNFPEIVEATGDNAPWMIVELDNCATDMMTAVKESYQYLISNNLAEGKV